MKELVEKVGYIKNTNIALRFKGIKIMEDCWVSKEDNSIICNLEFFPNLPLDLIRLGCNELYGYKEYFSNLGWSETNQTWYIYKEGLIYQAGRLSLNGKSVKDTCKEKVLEWYNNNN